MSFDSTMTQRQIDWRRKNNLGFERGRHNGKEYDRILPKERWEEGLWKGIQGDGDTSLAAHLSQE